MGNYKKMSAWQRREQLHRRRILLVALCVVLVLAVLGGTYGITKMVLQKTLPASLHTNSQRPASSLASKPPQAAAAVGAAGVSSGEEALEVNKNGLTGYQAKYPDMYAKKKVGRWKNVPAKTIYLTFDDGPSYLTPKLLAVLKQYNVKATFFLTDQPEQQNDLQYIRDIYKAGHVCAMHSASHDYKKIYTSVDAFLDDFHRDFQLIQKETDGNCAPFFRFPGGSNNPKMSASVHQAIIAEMMRRGFFFYDWDVDSGDATSAGAHNGPMIYENVIRGIQRGGNIVLMHNTGAKQATLAEVGRIIQYGLQNGYTFRSLDGTLDPSMYNFSNKTFIPLLKNNPNFRLSDQHEARFASLLGLPSSSAASSASSASQG